MTVLRRIGAVVTVVGLGATASGCSSDPAPQSPPSAGPAAQDRVRATSSPSFVLTPSDADVPHTRKVDEQYYSLLVPSSFKEYDESREKVPSKIWQATTTPAEEPTRIAVVVDIDPPSSAEEQALVLEAMQRGPESTVERTSLTWPGAEKAVLVRSVRPTGYGSEATARPTGARAAGAATGARRSGTGGKMVLMQLFAQVNSKLIVNIAVYGPEDQVSPAGLLDAMRSFRPKAG